MMSKPHIKLSELNSKINEAIYKTFNGQTFWVVADVTNHTLRAGKNYHNIELVEKASDSNDILAKIGAKAWGTGSARIAAFERITGQVFTNNIHVLLNVSVQFHAVYGLQVNINDIDTNFTLGVLEQQRQATLIKLVTDNPTFISKTGDKFLTANKKLSMPRVIQYIALISSSTSAGAEDFRHTLNTNSLNYRFSIDEYFTAVQGESNAQQFLEKIIEVFKSQKLYDVVVITRGGGAQTDFLIFDNYMIGKAIAKFPIPIITGIGHQKNVTIADLMAHTQTKTPTKAAEMIIAHNKAYEDVMLDLQKKVIIKSQQLFSSHFQALAQLNSIIVNKSRTIINQYKDEIIRVNQITINTSKSILYQYKTILANMSSQIVSKSKITVYNRKSDIENKISNLKSFNALFIKSQRGYLRHYVSVINMIAPANILKKGFAIVKQNNRIIAGAADIKVGSDIDVVLSGTSLHSTVKSKTVYDGNEFNI